jgi:Helix-turn-helix of DDE superfamily endonuclease
MQNRIDQDLHENPLSKRGTDAEFSVANQILLTFKYLRQYPTFLSFGFSDGISESYCHKLFHKIRPILAEIVGLKNPKKLRYQDVKTVMVDVTMQPIERPQEEQELYYNGSKKTYHQTAVNYKSGK